MLAIMQRRHAADAVVTSGGYGGDKQPMLLGGGPGVK